MLTIDGSLGEGGGQILRSALALSLLSGRPFQITKIRAKRTRPGLLRQHLLAVNAASEIGSAEVTGAEIGSGELTFRPRAIRAGEYAFALGGAGSTALVFQTVLLPLLLGASAPSTLTFRGGTHNPLAPPFDFLELSFLPQLARMGARIAVKLSRHGFYPAGGGEWSATVHPCAALAPFELLSRGELRARRARSLIAQLPTSIALRELDTLAGALGWERQLAQPQVIRDSHGPGNVLLAIAESEHVTEVISGCGERGQAAEAVAGRVAEAMARYLAADVPVGEHLADQLLLPLALGRGGVFRTLRPSSHFQTQIDLLRSFLGITVKTHQETPEAWRIEVPAAR